MAEKRLRHRGETKTYTFLCIYDDYQNIADLPYRCSTGMLYIYEGFLYVYRPTHELVEVDEHEGDVAVPLRHAHEDQVVVLHVYERHPLHSEHRLLLHLIPLLDVVADQTDKNRTVSAIISESAMHGHVLCTSTTPSRPDNRTAFLKSSMLLCYVTYRMMFAICHVIKGEP